MVGMATSPHLLVQTTERTLYLKQIKENKTVRLWYFINGRMITGSACVFISVSMLLLSYLTTIRLCECTYVSVGMNVCIYVVCTTICVCMYVGMYAGMYVCMPAFPKWLLPLSLGLYVSLSVNVFTSIVVW